MVPLVDDCIAALASAPGPAVRGIIRLSGPAVKQVVQSIFEPADDASWQAARLPARHAGVIRLPELRARVAADVLFWPNDRSYAGQTMAEIHTIGSAPVLECVLSALYRRGARPAQPGEFTMRAFLAGRIDLVQAEAVLGVIDSIDPSGLERALRQLAGGVSGRITALHTDLLELLADLEAGLDFVDEDIEFVSRAEVTGRILSAGHVLDAILSQSESRMVSTGRLTVVIAGLPNAGKSTLFNALAEDGVALVSPERGTTRDYLRAELDWAGLAVELIDTAGWEQPLADIDAQAQQFRNEQLDKAHFIVWCTPADLDDANRPVDRQRREECFDSASGLLHVNTKCDLRVNAAPEAGLAISAEHGLGLEELRAMVRRLATETPSDADGLLGTTAARCARSLGDARAAMTRAATAARSEFGDELIAAELREAIDALGQIVGAVYTDDLLDRIFSKFCIGK